MERAHLSGDAELRKKLHAGPMAHQELVEGLCIATLRARLKEEAEAEIGRRMHIELMARAKRCMLTDDQIYLSDPELKTVVRGAIA